MKCAIIDDEPLALGLLESYVKKTPMLDLCGSYSSAVEAMGGLQREPVDVIFLDIQMPDLNGLDFSKTIDTSRTRIIFTTAFSQYAIDGYKVNALDYLLKPISYVDFVGAVNRAQKWYDMSRAKLQTADNLDTASISHQSALQTEKDSTQTIANDTQADGYIFVKSDYKLLRIDFSEILYIILSSMRSIENTLPSRQFMRTHRSYIVNMQKVRVLERGQILFGEKCIPISDSYKEQVMSYLNSHLLQGR